MKDLKEHNIRALSSEPKVSIIDTYFYRVHLVRNYHICINFTNGNPNCPSITIYCNKQEWEQEQATVIG